MDERTSFAMAAVPETVGTLAFETFCEREKEGLYGALCLVTGNRFEAEERTQDAFARLLERWDRVGAMDDPRG